MIGVICTTNQVPTIPKPIAPNLSQFKSVDISSGDGEVYPNSIYGVRLETTTFKNQPISTRVDLDTKEFIKSLVENQAKIMAELEVDPTTLFIDTRKQKTFDWAKTTDAYQRIVHLSDLEDKWDGYDAPSFSKDQIHRALTLYKEIRAYSIGRGISRAKIEPFIAPGSDGTILFEWAGKRFPVRQLEVYVPVSVNENLEYLKTMSNSNSLEDGESESEGKFTIEGLYPILDWLFQFSA